MGRISEALMRLALQEQRLRRFETRVATGKEMTIDVFLRKGTKYVVRVRVIKGHGTPSLSFGDAAGSAVSLRFSGNAKRFSVIPERTGLYYVRALVRPARTQPGLATVAITLSCVIPAPRYLTYQIVASSCGSIRPWFIDDGPAEGLPEEGAGGVVQGAVDCVGQGPPGGYHTAAGRDNRLHP
jgi:hypothetical protein